MTDRLIKLDKAMKVNIKNVILLWIVVCLLIPAEFRLAGISVLDFMTFSIIALSLLAYLSRGGSRIELSDVEKSYLLFMTTILVGYCLNSFRPFTEQLNFVQSRGLATHFLYARLSFYGFMTVLMLLGGYHIVSKTMTTEKDIKSVVWTILLCGGVNAFITNVYWFINTGATFERYNFVPPIEGSQGVHMNYMSIVALLAISFVFSKSLNKLQRLSVLLVLVLAGFSILTVMVRQGWVMFVVSVVLFILLYTLKKPTHSNNKKIALLSLLFFSTIGILIVRNQEIILSLFIEVFTAGADPDQGSWLMRFTLIQRGVEVFRDNMFLGVGYGHYPAYSTVPVLNTGVETYVNSPHNGIIAILAETGIIGLICIFMISISLFNEVRKAYVIVQNETSISVASAVFSLTIITIFSQLISNSLIMPIPTERTMIQNAFLLLILFSLIAGFSKDKYLNNKTPIQN